MKFYLTKSAQRAAEGKAPAAKPSKAPKVAKAAAAAPLFTSGPVMAGAQPATPSPVSLVAVSPTPTPTPAPVSPAVAAFARAETAPARTAPLALSVPAAKKGRAAKAEKVPAVKPAKTSKHIVAIGGVPRVDLLPQEVRIERRASRNVRRAWLGVVGVAVLAAIATGGATLVSMRAQEDLAASQGETSSLSVEQAKYAKVKVIENQTTLIEAARKVGGSTDIDWNAYLQKLQATLPSDTTIKSVSVDSASATTAYAQSSAALQGVRIGTLTVTVESPTLPSVPKLLNGLVTLPGYVDATPGTVTASDGVYTANIVMHINQDAYSGLYAKKGK